MELSVLCKVPCNPVILQHQTLPGKAGPSKMAGRLLKTMLIMKMTSILLLAFTLQISASTYPQSVTIRSRDISLERVLRLLKQQTGYSFLCNQQVLEMAGHFALHIRNGSLEDALKASLQGKPLNYSIQEKERIVIIEERPAPALPAGLPPPVSAPLREIFGRVTNERGDGMGDVSVTIAGKPGGVATDPRGYFRIRVAESDSLIFSSVGYETQRIAVRKGRDIVEISLRPVQTAIQEVVVVGYGKQKKTSVVGAVSSVSPEELQQPGSQLSQGFAGRISGVIAVQPSGEPGKNGAAFWIRGVATTGSTVPLIFLDGIEIAAADMNSIDPVNIENFSILKDASATALYGARGANGVVLITTKRGKALARPIISSLVENSVVSPTRLPKYADAITYMNLYNEAFYNDNPNQPPQYSQAQIDGTKRGLDPYVFPNVNWFKTLYNPYSMRQHANVNIRGGSNNARYYMGISYYRDAGILKSQPASTFNSNILAQRFNFVNNLTVNITKSTEAELNLSADFNPYNGTADSAQKIFSEIMNANPVHFPATFPAPDTAGHPYFGNAKGGFQTGFTNPYADMVKGYSQSFTSNVLATVRLNQKLDFLTRGLSVNLLASIKNYSYSLISRSYQPYYYYMDTTWQDPASGKYNYHLTQLGTNGQTALSQTGSNDGNRVLYMQAMVNYERTFGSHAITGLLVYQQREANININGTDIVGSLPKRNQGVSGRVTYSYDGRYYVEGNFGYTGSENFAPGHKFGFFPSVGVGYLISNENYFSNLKSTITLLKLRASRGLAGNDQINSSTRFPYTSVVNLSNGGSSPGGAYAFGQAFNSRNGVLISRYANPNITWERAVKTNIGIDIEVLHQLNLTVDIFQENRSNIFQQRVLPSTLGLGQAIPYDNLEEVENKGVDLSLAYSHRFSRDLNVTLRGTFTYARNRIIKIEEPTYYGYPYLSLKGSPVNTLRGLVAERLFADAADISKSPAQFGVLLPGNIKYTNVSAPYAKDNIIDNNDKVPMGHPTVPEIVYGFGASVTWKKLDVSIFFQGVANNSFFINTPPNTNNTTSGITPFGVYQNNLLQAIASSHWSPTNNNLYAFYPRLTDQASPNDNQQSSWWLRNGAFMRLKNAEIGYTPLPWLRVYTNGINLLTFSGFKLWDPEFSANSSKSNGLGYPPERVVNLGVQVYIK